MEEDMKAVRKWFPTATIRVVPAGHGVRYQVLSVERGASRTLSSHLHHTEASAWRQAAKTVAEITRVPPRTGKAKKCWAG